MERNLLKLRIFLIESRYLNEAILLKPTFLEPPTVSTDEEDEDQIERLERI